MPTNDLQSVSNTQQSQLFSYLNPSSHSQNESMYLISPHISHSIVLKCECAGFVVIGSGHTTGHTQSVLLSLFTNGFEHSQPVVTVSVLPHDLHVPVVYSACSGLPPV